SLSCVRRPPPSPLFPYTTLFRSQARSPPAAGSASSTWPSPSPDKRLIPQPTPRFPAMKPAPRNRIKAHVRVRAGDLVPHELNPRSEEHTSELQSRGHLVCRLLLE